MNRLTRHLVAALAVVAAVVAGCGNDDNGGTASPGTDAPTTTAKATADGTDELGAGTTSSAWPGAIRDQRAGFRIGVAAQLPCSGVDYESRALRRRGS